MDPPTQAHNFRLKAPLLGLRPADQLRELQALLSSYSFDLQGKELTVALVLRIRAYYTAQERIKTLLNKERLTPGADFFVESLLFYLTAVLAQKAPHLQVSSERPIARQRGALHPDISIWNGTSLHAAIECKTNLGFNRGGWQQQYLNRTSRFRALFPNAMSILAVLNEDNGGGFPPGDSNSGTNWFAFLRRWPAEYDPKEISLVIKDSVESLVLRILEQRRITSG